ncbi:MAG: MFS transporter [Chitinophagaceae bacterium]|nr:MFS transporter [Chitinophagaceae bacterium]
MRIITRTVLILSFVSLFADIASEMLYPIIPVYLKEIGFSIVGIGVLEGFVNFTAGISKGYFGKLSDERGVRLPFIKLGYLLSALSKPLIGFFTSAFWIFSVRTMDRLGKGVRVAAKDALLSQEATKATKARVFGFNRSLDTAGATIGPAIALVFLLFYPGEYKTLFYIAFVPGLISVLFLFFLKEKKQPVSTLEKGNFFSFFKYWKIATPEYKNLVSGLLLFALFNSSDIFLLLATEEAIQKESFILFGKPFDSKTITIAAYVFYNLVFALSCYPLGVLADKLGYKKVFLAGLVLFACVYAGFAFDPSMIGIFILFFIYGIYAAATDGVTKAWITNIAHNKNTATAIGFYTSCQSICTLLASTIAGLVWYNFGSTSTFIATSGIAIIAFIYLLLKVKADPS